MVCFNCKDNKAINRFITLWTAFYAEDNEAALIGQHLNLYVVI